LSFPATLANIKVLVMSYSNMKPYSHEVHERLAAWVKEGGVLVYVGKDDDPYQSVMEWWNTNGNEYAAPSEHLFEVLGITPSAEKQKFEVGKGQVHIIHQNPKEFVMNTQGDADYIETIKEAYTTGASVERLSFKNHLYLERGYYDIIAVMDESVGNTPFVIEGSFIDLFDPKLPVVNQKSVAPNEQAFLFNIQRVMDKSRPQVLASAARIYEEGITSDSYRFRCKSPANTENSMRILLPVRPKNVEVKSKTRKNLNDVEQQWDAGSKTLYLGFENDPEGITVKMTW